MLKIRIYPDPVLRQRTEEVTYGDQTLLTLIPQMIATMEKNQGIGLAAPQIGVSKKIIIVTEKEGSHAFLNPKIVKQSREKARIEEGCLSLPGVFLKVSRAKRVEVIAKTLEGQEVKIRARGLAARIFQHEIDHIERKLIIHRIGPLSRWKLRNQLKKLRK